MENHFKNKKVIQEKENIMGTIKLKKMSEAQAEDPSTEISLGEDETKRQIYGEEADFEAAEETEIEHKNTEMIRCFKRNNEWWRS